MCILVEEYFCSLWGVHTGGNSKVDLEAVNGAMSVLYYSVGTKIHIG